MTDFWKDSPDIEARLARVEDFVAGTINSPDLPIAKEVLSVVESNGKLLRPALLIIGSRFGKAGDPRRMEELAAAIELLHVATLIHDDILDESPLRRGRPALHTRLGTKEAVLAGDWLFSRCFTLGSESAGPENARGLARLIAAICSAEIAQDLGKNRFTTSIRGYLRTIAGKTAALFSLALYVGASEAKAGRGVSQTLRRAGYDIGMAFQVIDDILDFESVEDVMRKPVGKDIAEGLCTLPMIYALEVDRPSLESLLAHGAERAAEAAARAIELGGVERARGDARRFTARALAEIDRLPPLPARDELGRLAERLLGRAY